ncbi:ABC transporter substrate-binding protein [Clostridiisalibacter paucivorans]|uniref:taurine ABC transporter substrate-binding protein n=1 Tax=Clostridiisalibacter paucivorans TaxID=408753 RepID=UPI00047E2708|nr:ABC transporter substrate-binding protein [Clostridiisalibacter paucivorans]
MKKLFKRIASVVLLSIMVVSLIACSSDSDDTNDSGESSSSLPKEINFGILRVPNDETLAIAEGLFDKYFTEKGIKCNFIVFDSGVDANKALASGSIDFATMGNTNSIVALSRDIDVEVVWIHEVLGEIEGLAVKNGLGIDKVQDLSGKKIATPFASTSHYILLNVLKEAGIDDKVQLLDMKTAEIVAAWERGDIQGAYTWQPSLGELLKDGEVIVSSKEMAEKGYITANVAVARKKFTNKYPDLVADFISCLTEAADMYRQNPEKAAAIVAEELGITPEDALLQMQGSTWHTREELLSEDYFGTSEAPGNFATIMKDTSDFLQEQESIESSPSQEEFNKYVNPLYIQKSLEKAPK